MAILSHKSRHDYKETDQPLWLATTYSGKRKPTGTNDSSAQPENAAGQNPVQEEQGPGEAQEEELPD